MFRKKGDIMNYYDEIKNILVDNAIGRKVRDSKRLTSELGKGYTVTRLKYMITFFEVVKKSPPLADQFKNINITWSNICEILYLKNIEEIKYYLDLSNKLCLTKRELRLRIKSDEYNRLPAEVKEKLKTSEVISPNKKIPSPVVLQNLKINGELSEKMV